MVDGGRTMVLVSRVEVNSEKSSRRATPIVGE